MRIFLPLLLVFCYFQAWTQQSSNWAVMQKGTDIRDILLTTHVIWVASCSDYGILKLDMTGDESGYFAQSNTALPSSCFCSIDTDMTGNIWAGFCYDGFAKFNGVSWSVYNNHNSRLPRNGIHDLRVDQNNVLWLATGKGLVSVFNNQWTVYDTLNSPLTDNLITSIDFSPNGLLWIGTWNGLANFDGKYWNTYTTSNSSINGNEILTVHVDYNNNVWVGTYSDGIAVFNGSYWQTFDATDCPVFCFPVKCITSANGTIWAGTIEGEGSNTNLNGGFARFNGSVWTSFTNKDYPLVDNNINCIEIDANGNKWIGTQNGLMVYNENGLVF